MKTANQIEGLLSKLLIVQERYPQLKANRSFQSIGSLLEITNGQEYE